MTSNRSYFSFCISGAILLMLVFHPLLTSAQYSSNSLYSVFGIGDLVPTSFAKQSAMGRAGVALASDGFINTMNPASLTAFGGTDVLMDFGIKAYYSEYTSNGENVSAFDGNFNHFTLAYPVSKWWGSSFGVKPFSEIGYSISTTTLFEGSQDDIETDFTGSGGISQIYFDNSFMLGKNLSLGLSFSYLTGTVNQTETTNLQSVGFFDVNTSNSYYLRNIYWGFGLLYNIHLKNDMLSFGISYHPTQDLIATYNHQITVESDDGDITLTEESESVERVNIPASVDAGMAYHFNDRLKLVADFGIQEWEGNSSLIKVANLTEKTSYHFGMEFWPDPKHTWSYLHKVQYRLGGHYENSYILVRDNQIQDYGISLGLGLPLKNEKSMMNFSVELGRMGTVNDGLVREFYAGFSLDFVLHNNWFAKKKYQ
jgi:hypothetical protein